MDRNVLYFWEENGEPKSGRDDQLLAAWVRARVNCRTPVRSDGEEFTRPLIEVPGFAAAADHVARKRRDLLNATRQQTKPYGITIAIFFCVGAALLTAFWYFRAPFALASWPLLIWIIPLWAVSAFLLPGGKEFTISRCPICFLPPLNCLAAMTQCFRQARQLPPGWRRVHRIATVVFWLILYGGTFALFFAPANAATGVAVLLLIGIMLAAMILTYLPVWHRAGSEYARFRAAAEADPLPPPRGRRSFFARLTGANLPPAYRRYQRQQDRQLQLIAMLFLPLLAAFLIGVVGPAWLAERVYSGYQLRGLRDAGLIVDSQPYRPELFPRLSSVVKAEQFLVSKVARYPLFSVAPALADELAAYRAEAARELQLGRELLAAPPPEPPVTSDSDNSLYELLRWHGRAGGVGGSRENALDSIAFAEWIEAHTLFQYTQGTYLSILHNGLEFFTDAELAGLAARWRLRETRMAEKITRDELLWAREALRDAPPICRTRGNRIIAATGSSPPPPPTAEPASGRCGGSPKPICQNR